MSTGAIIGPEVTKDTGLAQTRERFLTGELIGPGQVREVVLASWWRSRRWNVDAGHIDLSYVRDPDLDTPLTRNALPVLRNLRDNLQGQPISVMLTDARGVLLSRLTIDRDFVRHLDDVQLVPGFSYAEEGGSAAGPFAGRAGGGSPAASRT
jgi:sigma-54 dependent transcriptional regulator, acetoin dehydrogenase operon transcriptional activator AcoR